MTFRRSIARAEPDRNRRRNHPVTPNATKEAVEVLAQPTTTPMRPSRPAVAILTTGGTIDGLDYATPEAAPESPSSRIAGAFRHARLAIPIEITRVFAKDSRFIDGRDLRNLRDAILRSSARSIVVTHGTETMEHTAVFLGKLDLDRTIVIVGAMVPLSEGPGDAQFNLGAALMAAQLLPRGVYVAMNGRTLLWDNVTKDRTVGRFVQLHDVSGSRRARKSSPRLRPTHQPPTSR